jgi:hypothetical protein
MATCLLLRRPPESVSMDYLSDKLYTSSLGMASPASFIGGYGRLLLSDVRLDAAELVAHLQG